MGWFSKDKVSQVSGDNSINIQSSGNLTVSFEKKIEASRISLEKKSLTGRRMAVMAFVDASGSMSMFYSRGVVQELTERALGFAMNLDDDGEIPVYGFGYEHKHYGDVNISNYQGFVSRSGLGPYGSTNLSDSLAFLEKAVKKTYIPVYALIVTDGTPDDRQDVVRRLERLSKFPVFVKILVVGTNSGAWSFVKNILDNNNWAIDNINGKKISDPSMLTDQQFADSMVDELDSWFTAATSAGII